MIRIHELRCDALLTKLWSLAGRWSRDKFILVIWKECVHGHGNKRVKSLWGNQYKSTKYARKTVKIEPRIAYSKDKNWNQSRNHDYVSYLRALSTGNPLCEWLYRLPVQLFGHVSSINNVTQNTSDRVERQTFGATGLKADTWRMT